MTTASQYCFSMGFETSPDREEVDAAEDVVEVAAAAAAGPLMLVRGRLASWGESKDDVRFILAGAPVLVSDPLPYNKNMNYITTTGI